MVQGSCSYFLETLVGLFSTSFRPVHTWPSMVRACQSPVLLPAVPLQVHGEPLHAVDGLCLLHGSQVVQTCLIHNFLFPYPRDLNKRLSENPRNRLLYKYRAHPTLLIVSNNSRQITEQVSVLSAPTQADLTDARRA